DWRTGLFFFSSRGRHTRWPRDWSSDVCSSDLCTMDELSLFLNEATESNPTASELSRRVFVKGLGFVTVGLILSTIGGCDLDKLRSEERRVGKECRIWRTTNQ